MIPYKNHGRRHAPNGSDPVSFNPIYPIKVGADDDVLATGDGQFIFVITALEELDGLRLTRAAAYVTTVSSSGLPTVQLRKVGVGDMLTTKLTIDASDFSTDTAATPAVIDATYSLITTGDRIAIDVDVAGTGAKGLGVVLRFG